MSTTSGPTSSRPTRGGSEILGKIKLQDVEPFDGTRGKLSPFLTRVALHVNLHSGAFAQDKDKTLYTASHLTGAAFRWFNPYLQDFIRNQDKGKFDRDETNEYFDKYRKFTRELERIYGDDDEERTAIRKFN